MEAENELSAFARGPTAEDTSDDFDVEENHYSNQTLSMDASEGEDETYKMRTEEESSSLLSQKQKKNMQRSWSIVGWFIVFFCAANDITQSEYTQWSYQDLHFSSYFFLTWISSVLLLVSLPGYLTLQALKRCCSNSTTSLSLMQEYIESVHIGQVYTKLQLFWRSLVCLVLYFTSTYLWYVNLDMVPVSISFALSHSEILCVSVLSYFILSQRFTWQKIGILTFLTTGLALVAAGKSHSSSFPGLTQMFGSMIIIAATVLWGFYQVLFKRWFGHLSVAGVMTLQSLWGLQLLVFGIVVLPWIWLTNAEPAPSLSAVPFLATSVGFALTYFVLYPFALRFCLPVDVSIGSLVSIPVTALIDSQMWGTSYPALSIVGMSIVLVAVAADMTQDYYFHTKRQGMSVNK